MGGGVAVCYLACVEAGSTGQRNGWGVSGA